LSEGKSTRAA